MYGWVSFIAAQIRLATSFAVMTLVMVSCLNAADQPRVERLVQADQPQQLAAVMPPSTTLPFRRVVVFGDSLSDRGQLHANTFGVYAPYQVYWQGRMTNGPVWTDYIEQALSRPVMSYAVAGAATRSYNVFVDAFVPPLTEQVADYLASEEGDRSSPETRADLPVIWIGANNYLGLGLTTVQPAMADIERAARDLLAQGVPRLVIGTMPQLGGLPLSPSGAYPLTDEQFYRVTARHNQALTRLIAKLRAAHPQQRIVQFRAFGINRRTNKAPGTFGFTNLTEPCYRGDYRGNFLGAPGFCAEPYGYKFWDYVHPNSMMHCYYAAQFLRDLSKAGTGLKVQEQKLLATCRRLADTRP
jgi:phospholipase/lecithinase/hemolysin